MNTIQNKQEQMYVDIVQLVASIAKEGFGIDVIHNPLFSGVFKQQLEKHHQKLVTFITKYIPVEVPPLVTTSSVPEVQQEYTTKPQPVSEIQTMLPECTNITKQSE